MDYGGRYIEYVGIKSLSFVCQTHLLELYKHECLVT